jgi:hypothetical protein
MLEGLGYITQNGSKYTVSSEVTEDGKEISGQLKVVNKFVGENINRLGTDLANDLDILSIPSPNTPRLLAIFSNSSPLNPFSLLIWSIVCDITSIAGARLDLALANLGMATDAVSAKLVRLRIDIFLLAPASLLGLDAAPADGFIFSNSLTNFSCVSVMDAILSSIFLI